MNSAFTSHSRTTLCRTILVILFTVCIRTSWGEFSGFNSGVICGRLEGLVGRQRALCRKHLDAMVAIGQGSRIALLECQHQFKNNRWNCQPTENNTATDPLLNMASPGSPEFAFSYAIRSAGITYEIISACIRGEIKSCGCHEQKNSGQNSLTWSSPTRFIRAARGDWNVEGCDKGVKQGFHLGKTYVDAGETGEDSQSLVNLHNNRVGRMTVKKMITHQCKCLGVSGSCTTKTCWTTLPSFRDVGDRLALTYSRARQVEPVKEDQIKTAPVRLKLRRSSQIRRRSAESDDPHRRELVYLTPPPDYCEQSTKHRSIGTHGRGCNRTSRGIDGCEYLCCGRGFNAKIDWSQVRCNCKFTWCCHVTCSTCIKATETSTCL